MQIKSALIWAKQEFRKADFKIPENHAEIILERMLQKDRSYLVMHNDKEIDIEAYQSLIKRHLKGEPLGYLFGFEFFYGRKFEVNKNILIPRMETEMVVSSTLPELKDEDKVLDIGTGSGILAITLKLEFENAEFFASDVSVDALRIAKRNAEKLNAKVKFMQSDLLENISEDFDVIVSNLPYIPNKEEVQSSVYNSEPHSALFGGENGLELYQKLFQQLSLKSKTPRFMVFEIGWNQGDDFTHLALKYFSKAKTKVLKDLNGFDRVVTLRLH